MKQSATCPFQLSPLWTGILNKVYGHAAALSFRYSFMASDMSICIPQKLSAFPTGARTMRYALANEL